MNSVKQNTSQSGPPERISGLVAYSNGTVHINIRVPLERMLNFGVKLSTILVNIILIINMLAPSFTIA